MKDKLLQEEDMYSIQEIDEKNTILRVKKYLEKDVPRIMVRAKLGLRSSHTFDDEPKEKKKIDRNTQENVTMSNLEARDILEAINKIIDGAPRTYKIILKNVYLLDQTNIVAMELTGYGAAQYSVYKNRALLYFADAFQPIHDFNVYI